ncbi:MAG: ABC transporter substrate-binding protein [Puniceicoccales bacterium]|jgi:iron complex transport system substrate-binding protein|nr:ABC transporter substrate-binding protein [Puniceicoccales bacterium]
MNAKHRRRRAIALQLAIAAAVLLAAGAAWRGLSRANRDTAGDAQNAAVSASPAVPARVVSCSVLADEFLLEVAAPAQIAAVSHLAADPELCAAAGDAAGLPRLPAAADAESILRARPDLVIFTTFNQLEVITQVRRAGVETLVLDKYDTLDEAFASLRAVGRRLGPAAQRRAEDAEARCRRRVAALAERLRGARRVRVFSPSTFEIVPGDGTNFQDFCDHAGAENVAATVGKIRGHKPVPAEQLLSWPAERLVLVGNTTGGALAMPTPADIERAIRPFLTLPPYRFMAAVRERRAVLLNSGQSACISHHRVSCYEHLARQLHPERFTGADAVPAAGDAADLVSGALP